MYISVALPIRGTDRSVTSQRILSGIQLKVRGCDVVNDAALLKRLIRRLRSRARQNRGLVFRQHFDLRPDMKILDLGSADGALIASVLEDSSIPPDQIYIADIDPEKIKAGQARYGFVPVLIPESGRLPFADDYFDIVHCSSVIEHVTVPKSEVWTLRSGSEFKRRAQEAQGAFASEIRRLGRRFFVQTPSKWFLIESHSWLPLASYLPRRLLIPLLRLTNRFWIKTTSPDWNLLTCQDMINLFPGSRLVVERYFGFVKSIMAIK